jgi:hypothetical protein
LLPKGIWDALTKISHFFRDLCSIKLNIDHIERFEMNIVETLCKHEMIFPPSFFDSMEHLPIHLPFSRMVAASSSSSEDDVSLGASQEKALTPPVLSTDATSSSVGSQRRGGMPSQRNQFTRKYESQWKDNLSM